MILTVIILVFIGRKFYELAHEYDRNRWAYAILGCVSFYAGAWIGSFLIAVIGESASPGFVDTTNEVVLGLMGMPFGFLACWILYKILDKNWSKPSDVSQNTLDGDLLK